MCREVAAAGAACPRGPRRAPPAALGPLDTVHPRTAASDASADDMPRLHMLSDDDASDDGMSDTLDDDVAAPTLRRSSRRGASHRTRATRPTA